MKCSVIIRSFNEERHIGRLIDGIQRQELSRDIQLEIIVVDSGSTDSTVSIARHMGAIVLHLPKEEFSFGKALNLGCSYATGEILLFASAHVYPVYTDWISKITATFVRQEVGLVYGRQIGNENSQFSEEQIFSKWFPNESDLDQQNPFCNNANCAIRKSLWLVQPYDEKLTGLEDLAWADQLFKKGYKIAYLADATIVHVHEETSQKIRNRYRREAIAFKHIFPKIHVGFFDFIRLLFYNITSDIFHAIKKRCFWAKVKGIFIFRFMQLYGTYQGHNQRGILTKELRNRFYYPNSLIVSKSKSIEIDSNSKKIEYS